MDANLFDLQLKSILPDPNFVFQRLATALASATSALATTLATALATAITALALTLALALSTSTAIATAALLRHGLPCLFPSCLLCHLVVCIMALTSVHSQQW
jgi:hypothetical protein